MKGIGSVKSMQSYLDIYVKHFQENRVQHIRTMQKLENREVIKNFCKKEMPPNGIRVDFMETLGKESPSYSTVKNGQLSLRGEERALRKMEYGGLFVPFRYFVFLSFRLALWRGAKTK